MVENIPVDDVELMQVLERAQQLGGIEPAALLVEPTLALQVVKELSAIDEGEDEVEFLGVLERELERDDERVVDLGEDGALGEGVRHLGPRDNVRLADRLERVDPPRVLLAHLHHLAERALADHLEQVERVDRHRRVLRRRRQLRGAFPGKRESKDARWRA